jgi:hypothetical protein
MATRFYLPNSVGGAAAPVLPALDAGWEGSAGVLRLLTLTTRQDSPVVGRTFAGLGVAGDRVVVQYVGNPMAAQTIDGTVKAMIRVLEPLAGDDYFPACVLKVVSNDGSTVTGTLISAFGGGTEFPVATSGAIKFPPGWSGLGTAVTPVATNDGDRPVFEFGFNQLSASVSNATFRLGDQFNIGDLPETEGDNSGLNAWIEFSADIFPAAVQVPDDPYHFGPF